MTELKEMVLTVMEEKNMTKSDTMRWVHGVGFTVSETAELVDVRYQFAYNVLSRDAGGDLDQLNTNTSTKEPLKPQIIELWSYGMERKEIQEELKCSYPYVYKVTSEIEDLFGTKDIEEVEAK